jgi:hypothetical protein
MDDLDARKDWMDTKNLFADTCILIPNLEQSTSLKMSNIPASKFS